MVAFGVTKDSPNKTEPGFRLRGVYNFATSLFYGLQLSVYAVHQNHDERTVKSFAAW